MPAKRPPCMVKPDKSQTIEKVLAMIRENPNISFKDLHRLVTQRLGVRSSTAYDYLRRAGEVLDHGEPQETLATHARE